MYLSLAAVVVLTVFAAEAFLRNVLVRGMYAQWRIVATALVLVIAVLLTAQTQTRNYQYQGEIVLWTDNIAKRPGSAVARHNLGNAFLNVKRLDQAEFQFRQELHIEPDAVSGLNGLGYVFVKQGRLDQAVASFERALRLQPHNAEVLNNLGTVRQLQGKLEQAAECYQNALVVDPENYELYYNLGNVFLAQKKTIRPRLACNRRFAFTPQVSKPTITSA